MDIQDAQQGIKRAHDLASTVLRLEPILREHCDRSGFDYRDTAIALTRDGYQVTLTFDFDGVRYHQTSAIPTLETDSLEVLRLVQRGKRTSVPLPRKT